MCHFYNLTETYINHLPFFFRGLVADFYPVKTQQSQSLFNRWGGRADDKGKQNQKRRQLPSAMLH